MPRGFKRSMLDMTNHLLFPFPFLLKYISYSSIIQVNIIINAKLIIIINEARKLVFIINVSCCNKTIFHSKP